MGIRQRGKLLLLVMLLCLPVSCVQGTDNSPGQNLSSSNRPGRNPRLNLAEILPTLNLSQAAESVVRWADVLWTRMMEEGTSEVSVWDAGVYQLKGVWGEHHKVFAASFEKAHHVLGGQLQSGVSRWGFLRDDRPQFS